MRFSADAQEIFREWMQKIFKEAKENNLSESLQAHLLKMPKTIVSLALGKISVKPCQKTLCGGGIQ